MITKQYRGLNAPNIGKLSDGGLFDSLVSPPMKVNIIMKGGGQTRLPRANLEGTPLQTTYHDSVEREIGQEGGQRICPTEQPPAKVR